MHNTLACNWQQLFLNQWKEMAVEIISWSISTKVWGLARIELLTPALQDPVSKSGADPHVNDQSVVLTHMWMI